ncbi:MAG: hypothetical protein FRX49_11692 [Trebouxia sp. A1-2]|nr:MAG: hypothetical protein FRX49_11692 [Trebouxia sp. A1-2]
MQIPTDVVVRLNHSKAVVNQLLCHLFVAVLWDTTNKWGSSTLTANSSRNLATPSMSLVDRPAPYPWGGTGGRPWGSPAPPPGRVPLIRQQYLVFGGKHILAVVEAELELFDADKPTNVLSNHRRPLSPRK